jgi:hypothetical protein
MAAPTEAQEGRVLELVTAADFKPERTRWLAQDYIPLRAVTLFCGRPGWGKTTQTAAWVASVTRGSLPGDLYGTPRVVLFASAEDSIAATLVPRLMAAGADLKLVRFIRVRDKAGEALLTLPEDIALLAEQAEALNPALLVVDPLSAFLPGRLDSHKDQDVRRAIAPLAEIADSRDIAVVGIVHLNKSATSDVLARVAGSVAFTAAARSVLAFGPDPDDPDGEAGSQRILVHVKSNLSKLAPSRVYKIEPRIVDDDNGDPIPTSKTVYVGESSVTAGDMLATSGEERSALDEAMQFIRDLLSNGSVASAQVEGEAKAAGISTATLRRASMRLGVHRTKMHGKAGRWECSLPDRKMPTTTGRSS